VSGNAGINCSLQCQYNFPLGATLDLVASPDAGMIFEGWSVDFGDCNDNSNPCSLTMDREKTLTATFSNPNDIIFTNGFE